MQRSFQNSTPDVEQSKYQDYDSIVIRAPIKDVDTYETKDSLLQNTAIYYREIVRDLVNMNLVSEKQLKKYQSQGFIESVELRKSINEIKDKYNNELIIFKNTLMSKQQCIQEQENSIKQLEAQLLESKLQLEAQQKDFKDDLQQQQLVQFKQEQQLLQEHKKQSEQMINQISFRREENISLSSKNKALQDKYDVDKNEFTQRISILTKQLDSLQSQFNALQNKHDILINADINTSFQQSIKLQGLFKIKIPMSKFVDCKKLGNQVLMQHKMNQLSHVRNQMFYFKGQMEDLQLILQQKQDLINQLILTRDQFKEENSRLLLKNTEQQQQLHLLNCQQTPENCQTLVKIVEQQQNEIQRFKKSIYKFKSNLNSPNNSQQLPELKGNAQMMAKFIENGKRSPKCVLSADEFKTLVQNVKK
ncbi:Hypothetical_protein [Hexamita inflata]|uniref:Hypothetical_protein n=1 Tax=Hexamita inflata TaxID=28002 RepID=A0AA86V0C9_9EUKA|nr:Hypothetical protein HINF_LOCUS63179 [Hexamita inflata]